MKIKAFLALMLSCCILLPVLAQTKPAAPAHPHGTSDDNDVVKITTNLVQVDAVVTKDGKPVTNLTADDFEIYQDGKRQTITSFAYISNLPNSAAGTAKAPPEKRSGDAPPATPLQPNQPHRTMAFVVDDLGLSLESLGPLKKQLRKFINNEMQPNDLVAIIRTGGEVGALQQFTNDRRILNRAVDRLRWNPCSRVGVGLFRPEQGPIATGAGMSFCSAEALGDTLRALHFIIDALRELPGRKSLVLLSDSVPVEEQDRFFEPNVSTRKTNPANLGSSSNAIENTLSSELGQAGFSNHAALRKIAEKAIRASVVIYSVDTQGLPVTGITAADSLAASGRNPTEKINALLSARSRLALVRREGGDLIARQTGGFQVRNSNSFQLDRIADDQSGYYLIGYRPTEETFNRRFHHIKARVKRSGMTLRTRFGFFGMTEDEVKQTRSVRDVTNLALASPFRAQDITVDLTSFFAHDRAAGSVVRSFVYLDPRDLTFTAADGLQRASFDLHGIVFGDNGAIVEQFARSATLNLSEKDYEYAKRYGMGLTVNMPVKRPGSYQVRIAARDRISSRIGSAGQFITVPDLGNKKLAVSGIVLGTGRDLSTTDGAPQFMATPGARRFDPDSNLHFSYMIFNAANETGASRNLVMQARIFRDDKVVYSGAEVPIKAANQTDLNRTVAGGAIRLPAELEPGNYYLQVVITERGPKNKPVSVVQWVDFEIEN